MPTARSRFALVPLLIAALSIWSCRPSQDAHTVADAGEPANEQIGVTPDRDGVTADLLFPSIQPSGAQDTLPASVVIDLGRAVVDQDAVDKPLAETRVRVDPEIAGTVVFNSRSTLTFKPSKPFAYGTRYT